VIAGLASGHVVNLYRDGAEKIEAYVRDLKAGNFTDMIGRTQPVVVIPI
jgi:hypothetical protein